MNGLWDSREVPHRGWECVDVSDLASPTGVCEMCLNEEVRYLHLMRHPLWPTTVQAGRVRAGHMEEDTEAPIARERQLRNRAARRTHWLSRRWRVSDKGNPYLKVGDLVVTVFQLKKGERRGRWAFYAGETQSSSAYLSVEAAKLAAFEALFPVRAGFRAPAP